MVMDYPTDKFKVYIPADGYRQESRRPSRCGHEKAGDLYGRRLHPEAVRRGRTQATALMVLAVMSTISSICAFSITSGGDMAMASPDWRTMRPRSNALTKAL
jgi:hypothetical protein